jgi:hypothetical protein
VMLLNLASILLVRVAGVVLEHARIRPVERLDLGGLGGVERAAGRRGASARYFCISSRYCRISGRIISTSQRTWPITG